MKTLSTTAQCYLIVLARNGKQMSEEETLAMTEPVIRYLNPMHRSHKEVQNELRTAGYLADFCLSDRAMAEYDRELKAYKSRWKADFAHQATLRLVPNSQHVLPESLYAAAEKTSDGIKDDTISILRNFLLLGILDVDSDGIFRVQ